MRSTARTLAAYVPMIKFVGGPHKGHAVKATVHACAPEGLSPSHKADTPAFVANMVFQSRNNLSKRFRYRQPEDLEIDNVLTGGAEIIFKQIH